MGLFSRRAKSVEEPAEIEDVEPVEELDEEEAARERALRAAAAAEAERQRTGPFDRTEVEEVGDRIDLGGLLLPATNMELRLDLDEATQTVRSVTAVQGGSGVQLQAFAAPRVEGIWWEIRPAIAAEVRRQGGTVEEIEGTFGHELLTRMSGRTPDGGTTTIVSRFFGVDGPRWFVRGVFTGAAAADPQAAGELEKMVRQVVVVRGPEAMAPRDPIPLRLPAGARRADAAAGAPAPQAEEPAAPASDDFNPLERGPEIQEIR